MMTELFTDNQIELVSAVGTRLPAHLRGQFLHAIILGLVSSAAEEEFADAVLGAWEKVTVKLRAGGWDVVM